MSHFIYLSQHACVYKENSDVKADTGLTAQNMGDT